LERRLGDEVDNVDKLNNDIMYKSGYSFFLLKRINNKIVFANAAPQSFLARIKK